MSEPRHTLEELQRWMQAVITHPHGVVSGIESADACNQIAVVSDHVEQIVMRSRALTAIERLEIYNHAYFGRLLECLREEYSVLAAALGHKIFDAFAVAYLQSHPSQCYTLGRLGEKFPGFLAETRPTDVPGDEESVTWPEFMIDLARLERVVNEVFDGPGAEGHPLLDGARLQAIPLERWPDARLVCVPCLRLVKLNHPVNDFFTAIRRGGQPAIPEPGVAYVAVTRRDYRVLRYPLDAAQYELLEALVDGQSVGRAIDRGAAVSSLNDTQLAAAIQSWFRFWTAEGFFFATSNRSHLRNVVISVPEMIFRLSLRAIRGQPESIQIAVLKASRQGIAGDHKYAEGVQLASPGFPDGVGIPWVGSLVDSPNPAGVPQRRLVATRVPLPTVATYRCNLFRVGKSLG